MTSRRHAVMPLVALMIAGAVSLWLSRRAATDSPPDRTSAGGTIYDYLHALEGQNPRQIADLLAAAYDGEVDIDDRLGRFGGASASKAAVRISSEPSPEILAVTIRTTGPDAQELAWTEHLIWRKGKWRLVLGSARDLPDDVSTPSESPPP